MNLAPHYQHSVRIYSEDVDFMGIVYHANYLCYFERARTEMLREHNLHLSELIKQDILFAIHGIDIKYIYPARLDDLLTIKSVIKEKKACSFVFMQTMHNQDNRLICEANIKVVSLNGQLKPQRLPDMI